MMGGIPAQFQSQGSTKISVLQIPISVQSNMHGRILCSIHTKILCSIGVQPNTQTRLADSTSLSAMVTNTLVSTTDTISLNKKNNTIKDYEKNAQLIRKLHGVSLSKFHVGIMS